VRDIVTTGESAEGFQGAIAENNLRGRGRGRGKRGGHLAAETRDETTGMEEKEGSTAAEEKGETGKKGGTPDLNVDL